MKLYLTGEPCNQQRHCYFVQGNQVSFIVDCGYQRCYAGDELPHLTPEQIRSARYLFLTHSHENQSGALEHLYNVGFHGRVVTTTETARQLTAPIDQPVILEGLCLPYTAAELPGGISLIWGRSGHCSGSAWFSISEGGRTIFFSGDYYTSARVHMADPIVGIKADLAVLDCDYGHQAGSNARADHVDVLMGLIREALDDGRPVLLPVPKYGRGLGILSHISERLPDACIFGDEHFINEINHLDATAMWVKPSALDMLAGVLVRPYPDFVALGVYFLSDPQLDAPASQHLADELLAYGTRVIFTGTVEPQTHAALMLRAGTAQKVRYGVHCTQDDMLRIAAQNEFGRIIAYRSDYEPTQSVYDV